MGLVGRAQMGRKRDKSERTRTGKTSGEGGKRDEKAGRWNLHTNEFGISFGSHACVCTIINISLQPSR